MAIEITGYKFITGKAVKRPWGIEYAFCARDANRDWNDTVMLKTGKETEEEISKLIEDRLAIIAREPEVTVEEEIVNLEEQKATLVSEIEILETEKASLESEIAVMKESK
jgi:hypothetical protein